MKVNGKKYRVGQIGNRVLRKPWKLMGAGGTWGQWKQCCGPQPYLTLAVINSKGVPYCYLNLPARKKGGFRVMEES